MSLIICESFAWSNVITHYQNKWSAVVGGGIAGAGVGQHGRLDPLGNQRWVISGGSGNGYISKSLTIDEQDDLLIAGFCVYSALGRLEEQFITFLSDSGVTSHITLGFSTPNFYAYVNRGGVRIAQTDNNVLQPGGIWQYVELKVRLSDSTMDLELQIDGYSVPWLAAGPWDTKNGGTMTVFDTVQFWFPNNGLGSNPSGIGDLYLCNEKDGVNDDFLGDIYVECLFPDGNDTSQWDGSDGNQVDNYALVDEHPPNDLDYVTTDVDDEVDIYTFGNLISVSGVVAGVQVTARGWKTDTGPRSLAVLGKDAGGTLDVGPDVHLAGSAMHVRHVFDLDPLGNAWTRANVDADHWGIKARP